jgi:putative transposase
MQQPHLLACIRYIEMNPVRAKLVQELQERPWSSSKAHISGQEDGFIDSAKLLTLVGWDWKSFLCKAVDPKTVKALCKHERTGRPLGDNRLLIIKKTLKFRYHFVFRNKYAIKFRVSDFLIRIIVYTIMKVN